MLLSKLSPIAMHCTASEKSEFPSQCCLEEKKVSCFSKKGGWRLERVSHFMFSIAFRFLIAKHEEEKQTKKAEKDRKSFLFQEKGWMETRFLFYCILEKPSRRQQKVLYRKRKSKTKNQNLSY